MAAGSGPEPQHDDSYQRGDAPEGWTRDGGEFVPDPAHPLYPFQRGGRREKTIFDRLARDEAVLQAAAEIAANADVAGFDARWREGPLPSAERDAFFYTLASHVFRAAERVRPPGVT